MKKKLIVLLMVVSTVATLFAGCGSSSSSSNDSKTVTKKEEKKEPLDLTGTWTSENNDGSWMEAEIKDDVIAINWVSDNGDTKSIYWIGTYVAPEDDVDEYSWTSDRDKEQTDSALLASTDDTKEFAYTDGEITYEASALGTTTTIHLEKTE